MLKLGEKSIKSLYLGSKAIKKAYYGDKLVFNKKPYYCEVEYIESTGNQYIDSNYYLNDNSMVTVRGSSTDATQTNKALLGVGTTGNATDRVQVYYGSIAGGVSIRMGNTLSARQSVGTNEVVAVMDIANKKGCLNNTEVLNGFTSEICKNVSLGLFNRKEATGFNKNFCIKARIKRVLIEENGVTVREYIPVLDNNMKPCLYDKVSGKLFYNQGSGDFLYGREIHEVEYLESTGIQYIDTGIIGNSDTKAELALIISSLATGNVGVFGSRGNSANSNLLAIGYGTSLLASDFNNSSYSSYRASVSYELDTKYICYTSKEKRFIKDENGVVLAENTTLCNDTMSTSNLLLFAETGVSLRQQGKMFYAKIWNDNILVRDYIPAVDENGKGFMFDRVTHTIFDNQGSGEFLYGDKI